MFPTTRQQFTDRCLRALGFPVIEINVDEDQVADRVDDALKMYWDYHFDGVEKLYYKYQMTAGDISNNYVILPPTIDGVTKIFPTQEGLSNGLNMFNVKYQYMLNNLPNLSSISFVDYEITMSHIENINFFFHGVPGIRFNKVQSKLFMDIDWTTDVVAGHYIIVECYRLIDPDQYPDVWQDPWLIKYATALIKLQWGVNMKKFVGVKLPGGIMMDGQTIYTEAAAEITALEYELKETWQEPPKMIMG